MEYLFKTIGKRIAGKRKKMNFSQEKLAEVVGLHRNYIGYIERAEKHATLENLYKIVKALNTTLEELLKGF